MYNSVTSRIYSFEIWIKMLSVYSIIRSKSYFSCWVETVITVFIVSLIVVPRAPYTVLIFMLVCHLRWMDHYHKYCNVAVPYPTLYHFATDICTYVHISIKKLCNVGHLSNTLWELQIGFITCFKSTVYDQFLMRAKGAPVTNLDYLILITTFIIKEWN